MSAVSCDACANLREHAPNFVQNGVTEIEAASLKNNTGLNPSLTVTRDDCSDLNDVNDCLIGHMGDALDAYDVCDWKEFMRKLLPNLYETLKAMIAAICGLWSRVTTLCSSVDTLLGLIRGGSAAKSHRGYWTDTARAQFSHSDYTSESGYWWDFPADILQGFGCSDSRRLGRYTTPGLRYDDVLGNLGSRNPGWNMANYSVGDIWCYFRKSDIVGVGDMTEGMWTSLMFGRNTLRSHVVGPYTVYVKLRGYVRANDGREYNTDIKAEFGEDIMVMEITHIISSTGAISGIGDMSRETRTYDA